MNPQIEMRMSKGYLACGFKGVGENCGFFVLCVLWTWFDVRCNPLNLGHLTDTFKIFLRLFKIFWGHQKMTASLTQTWSKICIKTVWVTFAFGMGIKTQKSPSAHVWDYRIWLRCRTMFSLMSTDRYDRKQACKHTCWVLEVKRKFFRATQSPTPCPLKHSFLEDSKRSESLLPLGWVSKLKITISSRVGL